MAPRLVAVMTPADKHRTYKFLFGIRRSVRYHMRRRQFYEKWHAWTVGASAVIASSAGAAIFAQLPGGLHWLAAAAAILVGVLSALDLAVATVKRADQHSDLARRFIDLEKRFAHGNDLDDEAFASAVRTRLEIQASEPPTLRLLDAMCHYEEKRSVGYPPEKVQIPALRRWTANWISHETFARRLPA